MKKFFACVTALVLAFAVSAQTPAFKRSGTNLPFAATIASNHVFNMDRGGGLPPANVPFGVLQGNIASNLDLKFSGAIDGTPVNAQELKNVKAKIYSGQKFGVAYIGDSVGVDVAPAFESEILPFIPRSGAAVSSTPYHLGNYFYGVASGTRTEYLAGLDGVFWGAFAAFGNGATWTSASALSNGIVGSEIGFAWLQSSGFGSFLVETQSVSHGVWGTLTTLSSSGGAGLTMATTNISVPATNYAVRYTATGSNIVLGVAIRDTRAGRGYQPSQTTTPGFSPIGFMINAGSNNVAKFLQWQNPSVIFYQAERLSTATNEVPWLEGIVRAALPKCDLVWLAHHVNYSSPASPDGSRVNRDFYLQHAKRYGRAFADTYAKSLSFFSSTNNSFYNGDLVHLENIGRASLHAGIASELGLSPGALLALGCSFPGGGATQTNDTTKANLAGGNIFTGIQTFAGYVTVSNYSLGFSPGSELAFMSPTLGGADLVRFKRRSQETIFAVPWSASSEKSMLTVSNISGVNYMETDSPYAMNVGKSGRWSLWAEALAVRSNLPPAYPYVAGEATFWNSNGVVYLLTSGLGTNWTGTNKLAP